MMFRMVSARCITTVTILGALFSFGAALLVDPNKAFSLSIGELTVTYKVCVEDNGEEDGDKINLMVDGDQIYSDYTLKNTESCKDVQFRVRHATTLQVTALNEGRLGNNTAKVTIRNSVSGKSLADENWRLITNESVTWIVWAISEDEVRLVAPDDPPEFIDTIPSLRYKQGETITGLTLPEAISSTSPLSYDLSPTLPAGLNFNPRTRLLSGTAREPSRPIEYTYTVTDSDGQSASLKFIITVDADLVPSFGGTTVAAQTYMQNIAIAPLTLPAATGGDGTPVYRLTPDLPAGLSLDLGTRQVTGTPTGTQAAQPYSWTATDTDGDEAVLTFTIEVVADHMPSFGGTTVAAQTYMQNIAIAPLTLPAATGGDGTPVYRLTPDLPAGLSLDLGTRQVTGTPTGTQAAQPYSWTATDTDGDEAVLTFTIEVVADHMPSFGGTTVAAQTYMQNIAIAPLTLPAATGGDGTPVYRLTPDLPAGLSLDLGTRQVTGTPTGTQAAQPYSWTATDTDGDEAVLTFTIEVVADHMPSFGGTTVAAQTYMQNIAIAPLTLPAATGGDGTPVYRLTPDLPAGLSLDLGTRQVTGTPTGTQAAQPYSWTATDTDGDEAVLTFTIEVVAAATPGVELSADTLVVVEGREGVYSISLRSSPNEGGTVVVQPSSTNPHVSFTPGSLTFNSQTWADPQSIAFEVAEENQDSSLTIEHAVDGYGDERDSDAAEGGTVRVSLIPRAAPEPEEKQAVQATVAGVAAATVSNVTSNIGARFSAPAAPTGGVSMSLAGMPVAFGKAGPKHGERAFSADSNDTIDDGRRHWRHRNISANDLLQTSSFEIVLGAGESDKGSSPGIASRITVWGRGDLQFFESGGGRKSGYDGDLAAGYLGTDIAMAGGWLAGVAVSRIAAEADYTLGSITGGDGTLEAELTNVHPYIRAALNDRSEAWAILGFGAGEVTDTARTGGAESKSDMSMRMLSAGARHSLASDAGIDWAVLGDGSFATVETDDGTESIDGITADVWRARFGVEASYTTVTDSGSSFTPFLEVAGRKDGGDGASGLGLEISPGLSFSDPASGLSIEARGRVLAVHSADNHREYGASVTASLTPGLDGRGLSMAIAPIWGTPDAVLDQADRGLFFEDAGDHSSNHALSLNSRLSYGFAAGGGILAPFADLSLHDGDRHRVRIGSRYSLGSSLDLELSGGRSGGSSGGSALSVLFSGRTRF